MEIRNILLVIERLDDVPWLIEKAERLALSCRASLSMVQIVHEEVAEFAATGAEQQKKLKAFILSAAQAELERRINSACKRVPGVTPFVLWSSNNWEATLHAAKRVGADLILKAVTMDPAAGRPIRTPDEWNLLRHTEAPVLLLRSEAWSLSPVVLAAVDPYDSTHDQTSQGVLRYASLTAQALGGVLDIVVAYPEFEPWAERLAITDDLTTLCHDVEEDIRTRVRTLARVAQVNFRRVITCAGSPVSVIGRLVQQDEAQMVVLGTHGRGGISGVVLGNTCERVLQATHCDVLTVPSAKAP
jgi:universal stress protein E